jgi:hypothetical protein
MVLSIQEGWVQRVLVSQFLSVCRSRGASESIEESRGPERRGVYRPRSRRSAEECGGVRRSAVRGCVQVRRAPVECQGVQWRCVECQGVLWGCVECQGVQWGCVQVP